MITEATIDWETRSTIDLKKRGVFVYAECPTTEPVCLSLALNADRPVTWIPQKFYGLINPDNIKYEIVSDRYIYKKILDSDKIIAQNSMFEYLIWNEIMVKRFNWPPLPLEKLHDTMAQLAYHALPMNLEQGAEVLGLSVQKNMEGNKAMKVVCRPRRVLKADKEKHPDWRERTFWDDAPEKIEATINYCCEDTEVERMVHHRIPELPSKEREIWLLDQRINLRGVTIDVANAKAIIKTVKTQEARQLKVFQETTNGAVSGPRSYVALKNWINEQAGLRLKSVGKEIVAPLIKKGALPPHVLKALKIKAELSKSSVAKFTAMLNRMSKDGRVRGWSAYHAATTGRWAAWGLQLHNMPRVSYSPEQFEQVTKLFREGNIEAIELLWANVYTAASMCVRGVIMAATGKRLICSDYSAVEGRGLAFLAGEQWVLDAYARGEDMYKHAVSDLLGVPYDQITKDQRQIGKAEELFLGYGGGIGAFATGAKTYKIDLEKLPAIIMSKATPEELSGPYGAKALAAKYLAQNPGVMSLEAAIACDVIKRKWRAKRPQIVAFWKGLENATREAIRNPGKIFSYRSIRYCVNKGFLKCQLPNGRIMHYFDPRLGHMHFNGRTKKWVFHEESCQCEKCKGEKPEITYMGMRVVDGKSTRQWVRLKTYGGKESENVTQGFCRDILAEGMLGHEAAGYEVILDVHDEDAVEKPYGEGSLEEFNKIMEIVPSWAHGMPIKAEGWEGKRYRKG